MSIADSIRTALWRRMPRLFRRPEPGSSVRVLTIPREAVAADEAMGDGGVGKRKIVVTEQFEGERPVSETRWRPPVDCDAAAVLGTADLELSYFNEQAPQDRHLHRMATEIYTVQSGEMRIWASNEVYTLGAGDAIVILPDTWHQVLPTPGTPFCCQVIAANVSIHDKIRSPS
jgi:mannose-6-phosphate isomerase-like protein (cupin superfamily)